MRHEVLDEKIGSIIGLTDNYQADFSRFSIQRSLVSMIWNKNSKSVKLWIDKVPFELKPNQIITLTFLQQVEFEDANCGLHGIVFNREFYCILDHDQEVSCNGILFFGTQEIPIITIKGEELRKFEILLAVFIDEFETTDKVQGEMLQMLLKRFIIKCVRLAKEQHITKALDNKQIDIVRQYNLLVDLHYKTKRHVSDYAELLNKSPKTLSNLFGIYNQKSPQEIIHDRFVLEAKRLLYFTDKQVTEIGFELGYEDPAYFSRFFKKHTGKSPKEFKEDKLQVL